MKILVVCQYYYPEPFRITDICEELVRRGHEVTVVTGTPNYPEGVIYPGYEKGQRKEETLNGVKIHRCFTIPRKSGALYRLLNYFSFAISSSLFIKKCKANDGKPFDVVFVNQLSPVMMGQAAITYAKKYKVPSIMYCLDLWPESLVAGGIKRASLIYRIFHSISKKIYTKMDRILITSRMFSGYLEKEFDISADNISYLPQYAEGIFDKLPPKTDTSTIDLMFAGNIGTAQSVQTILEAAELLKGEFDNLYWHIVGSGSELDALKEMAEQKQLNNVIFYGRRPLDEMPALYQKADAMLVTLQKDPVLSLTLPGKVQSYMAVGKPIIAAIDGETAEVIQESRCGLCSPAEDASALVKNVCKFIATENKQILAQNAYLFYCEHFAKDRFLDELEQQIKELLK